LRSTFRFSIGATFTAEPLHPVFTFWGRQLNLDCEVRFAPYNQVEQTLLDARGEFAANTHGVNVIALRLEDFGGLDLARVRPNIHHLLETLARSSLPAPAIVCVCPGSRAFLADAERAQSAEKLVDEIRAAISRMPGLEFLDYRQIEEYYPVEDYEAPGGGQLGHIPYNELYYTALGTALARRAHAIVRPSYKAVALDCDDTLWKGLCGEDGPSGIALDAPRRALQQFMLAQRDVGVLLTMASKNNEPDVLEAFEHNPEMPLQLRHFIAWRINWESKAENLAALAKELNIGLDSFIFVDDNPKECAEVESSVPEVLSVPLPAEVDGAPDFLRHIWAFDRGVITGEDRRRNDYYAQGQRFGAELRAASHLKEFLAGLALSVRIAPLGPGDLPRAAQLTQRTNQFNFTTIRRSEAEIQRGIEDSRFECFTIRVADRFGDYGFTGLVLTAAQDGELAIDTFLLSCRVLGRGVEHRIMAFLAGHASERGLSTIVARLEPTPRNAPAKQFLDSLGPAGEGGVYRLAVAAMRGLEWKPNSPESKPEPPIPARVVELNTQARPDYVRIARTLAAPAQILDAMRKSRRSAIAPPEVDPPLTEMERRLAEIWADLLSKPVISASDNFFDLGGHSLLAVLLLVRIQEAFGVEISIDDVYSGTLTLAELAQRIELLRLGDPESPEYAELLREIEAMSDEEARQMLAEGDREADRS
jgi:FkbH-like protein